MSKVRNAAVDSVVRLPPTNKNVRPAQKLAYVVMALLDAVASDQFAADDGELWNELKAIVEEVQRGR